MEVATQQSVRVDNKRQQRDDRWRRRQSGGDGMLRCNATTSQDGDGIGNGNGDCNGDSKSNHNIDGDGNGNGGSNSALLLLQGGQDQE